MKEARAIRKAAIEAVNKEFAEKDIADKMKEQQKSKDLEQEAAEIEKRMEREANGEIQLYSPDHTISHTPPRPAAETEPEKSPDDLQETTTEPVNEIYTNDELTVAS